jgi:hypothetical protein
VWPQQRRPLLLENTTGKEIQSVASAIVKRL